jgi:hypothetical protein
VIWPKEVAGEEAEMGNACHAFNERWVRNYCGLEPISAAGQAQIDALATSPKFRAVTARMIPWLEKNVRLGWRPEVAMAWDYVHDTGRSLPAKFHRDYSDAADTEIPGTADNVTWDGSVLCVDDWKTGITPAEHYRWQLRGLGLAAARASGATQVRARIVYFWEDTDPVEVIEEIDALQLDSYAVALQGWFLEAQGKPEPQPGPQCGGDYCPYRAACPVTQKLVQSVTSAVSWESLALASLQTPEDAGRAYLQLKVIKEATDAVSARIREIAKNDPSPAPTSHGRGLRLVEESQERFSKERLLEAGARGKELLEELKALGAVAKSTSIKLKEQKLK